MHASPQKASLKIVHKAFLAAGLIFVLCALTVAALTLFRYHHSGLSGDFWDRLLAESYGMLMDFLVIGVLMLWLNQKGRKHQEIRRYFDEIEDFRDWRFMEAAYRITGNVKRLNQNGITDIDLSRCTLKNMHLPSVDLTDALLVGADLSGAYLARAVLRSADLNGANLKGAFLWRVDMTGAVLVGADLREAKLEQAVLNGANLYGADLSSADLTGIRDATVDQLSEARTLYNAILEPEMAAQIKTRSPGLLQAPSVTPRRPSARG